jgi:hypothetical protein
MLKDGEKGVILLFDIIIAEISARDHLCQEVQWIESSKVRWLSPWRIFVFSAAIFPAANPSHRADVGKPFTFI